MNTNNYNAEDHLLNPALIGITRRLFQKRAFVPGGDPSMTGGGAAGAGGAAGGGMPPGMDPAAAMGGGGGGGGMPPSGGGGSDPKLDQILQLIQQQQAGGAGAGASGGNAAIKPKIDVNVELMQIKHMLAKIIDHLGIQMPAQDMVATPEKLMTMAQGGNTASAGGAGGGGGGAIGGMPPMQGMAGSGTPGGEKISADGGYVDDGVPFSGANLTPSNMSNLTSAAAALRVLWGHKT